MLHDYDVVTEHVGQGQVVADEEVGHSCFQLQTVKEFDHRLLYRHVQGTGGFVADNDFRLQHQGPGNGDTLPLAAGHAVGIAVCKFLGQIHEAEHFPRFFIHLFFSDEAVVHQGLADNIPDPLFGVEGCRGILENHLDILPGLPEFLALQGSHVFPVKEDAPAVHGVEPGQNFCQGGFPGA